MTKWGKDYFKLKPHLLLQNEVIFITKFETHFITRLDIIWQKVSEIRHDILKTEKLNQ